MSRPSLFARCYAAMMLIFPRAFRARFGDEMRDMALDRVDAARLRGTRALLRESLALFADLLRTAPSAWATLRAERPASFAPGRSLYPRDHMDILLQDLRYAVRSLLRRPAFTLVAAITLAFGIGANTAIFSVVNAVLIRSLPYPEPDQLVLLWGTQGHQGGQGVVYADYLDWRTRNRSFSDIAVTRGQSVNITGGDAPERMTGLFVSANLFPLVGAKMSQGRAFTTVETDLATREPVAMVQYEAWRTRFGSDPQMIGKTITANGTTFTVVGITAPNTQIPMGVTDLYLPMPYYPNAKGFDRGVRSVLAIGRLKPGVSMDAARRDVDGIAKQLEAEYPATNAGTGAEVIALKEQLVGRVRESLLIIAGAVLLVLLIACANVANLQLARGASRARELSVRAALGAGRARIAQQLLTESVVLSLIGGIAGVAIAFGLMKVIIALIGAQLPVDASAITIDISVLLFALGMSVGTGLLFGLAPAWQASKSNVNDALRTRTGGAIHARTRNTLVVAQLALSLALLASAGLLTRSLLALEQVNPGFDGSHVLAAQFRLPVTKYDAPDKITAMFDRTLEELRAMPGVEAAALVRASPFSQNGETYPVTIEGKPATDAGDAPSMLLNSITPGYFATLRIPLVAGRDVTAQDRLGLPGVIVVNKSFADAIWPGQSAIGKRLKAGGDDWLTVVGVVGDTKHYTLHEHQFLQGYVPHAQRPQIFTSIVVRTTGDPLTYTRAVREAVWRVDRDQPVWGFRAMTQELEAVTSSKKAMMWLTASFAVVALLVSTIGIYGVLSYTMSQRTQELGIRIALGAESRLVTRMVIGEGAKLVGLAVASGLALAFGSARLLRNQLFGVEPSDALTYVVVTAVLSAVAIAACWIPARRASRVDPMVALRSD